MFGVRPKNGAFQLVELTETTVGIVRIVRVLDAGSSGALAGALSALVLRIAERLTLILLVAGADLAAVLSDTVGVIGTTSEADADGLALPGAQEVAGVVGGVTARAIRVRGAESQTCRCRLRLTSEVEAQAVCTTSVRQRRARLHVARSGCAESAGKDGLTVLHSLGKATSLSVRREFRVWTFAVSIHLTGFAERGDGVEACKIAGLRDLLAGLIVIAFIATARALGEASSGNFDLVGAARAGILTAAGIVSTASIVRGGVLSGIAAVTSTNADALGATLERCAALTVLAVVLASTLGQALSVEGNLAGRAILAVAVISVVAASTTTQEAPGGHREAAD